MLNRGGNLSSDMKRRLVQVHQYQKINVTICCRLPVSVGAEEDHLLWMKLANNLSGNVSDAFKNYRGDIRTLLVFADTVFLLHIVNSSTKKLFPPIPLSFS